MVSIGDFGPIDASYLAHSANDVIRYRASSGGFIKSFLVYLLDSGKIDFAIVTRTGGPQDPLTPETIITNSREDILSTRTNSVYMVHNALDCLGGLKDGRKYALVGLPCQVTRLRQLQAQGKYTSIVLVIGLFCNYAPRAEFTKSILQKLDVRAEDLLQIEYRGNGWPGGFTAHLRNGQRRFISTRDYWSNDLHNAPDMCRRCSDTAERADIWVGDPWNLQLEETDTMGMSLVICRNAKATKLVNEAATAGYIKLYSCTTEQLLRSQGYHIEEKKKRGAQLCGSAGKESPSKKTERAATLLAHLIAARRRALAVLRAVLTRLKCTLADLEVVLAMLEDADAFTASHLACRTPLIRWFLRRSFNRRTLIWYWREDRKVINLGDYITQVLLNRFGYKTVAYSDAKALGILSNYDFCLLVIGSELHKDMIDWLEVPQVFIWGQGKGHGEYFDVKLEPYASKLKIFAVRGPHTKRQLGLDKSLPEGDPALLMPLFFKVKRDPANCKVAYVPHWTNRSNWQTKLPQLGAEKFIDIMCTRKHFWRKLREIVSARFVLTNSLHTAIVCHAYGTPWALCLAEGDELNFPDKWRDFFELLGLGTDIDIVSNYQEGQAWWNQVAQKAANVDLVALLSSFPLPIKDKRAQRMIKSLVKSGPWRRSP